MDKNKRLGVVALAIRDRETHASAVNRLISEYGGMILGRLGVPCKDKGLSVIALIMEGTTDDFGALSGKLGMLKEVRSKVTLFGETD